MKRQSFGRIVVKKHYFAWEYLYQLRKAQGAACELLFSALDRSFTRFRSIIIFLLELLQFPYFGRIQGILNGFVGKYQSALQIDRWAWHLLVFLGIPTLELVETLHVLAESNLHYQEQNQIWFGMWAKTKMDLTREIEQALNSLSELWMCCTL